MSHAKKPHSTNKEIPEELQEEIDVLAKKVGKLEERVEIDLKIKRKKGNPHL